MNSSGNVSVQIVESELSTIQITQMGTFEGFSIAVAIGIVAAIGLVIRGAFIYYIKYKAPKKRQINKLMLHDQVNSPTKITLFRPIFINLNCRLVNVLL